MIDPAIINVAELLKYLLHQTPEEVRLLVFRMVIEHFIFIIIQIF